MSGTGQATDWESRYQQGTTGWQRQDANPALLAWLAGGTLEPGRILVPGAGRSVEPRLLADAGFAVTTVDLAPSAVAWQRESLAGTSAHVAEANLLEWQPDRWFDAVYEQTCICALPPAIWDDYAARLADWLRPGGVLAALFLQTGREGGPPFHCDIERMRALFPSRDWIWPAALDPAVGQFSGMSEQPVILRRT